MDAWKYLGIREVFTVPRQQVLYTMMGYDGDMQRIDLRFWWQNPKRHDLAGDLRNLGCSFGSRGIPSSASKRSTARSRVTCRGLVDDIL